MVCCAHRLLKLDPALKWTIWPNSTSPPDSLARKYYEAAYAAGYTPASLGLGYIYQFGIGVPADAARAAAYYKESLVETPDPFVATNTFAYHYLYKIGRAHV